MKITQNEVDETILSMVIDDLQFFTIIVGERYPEEAPDCFCNPKIDHPSVNENS